MFYIINITLNTERYDNGWLSARDGHYLNNPE